MPVDEARKVVVVDGCRLARVEPQPHENGRLPGPGCTGVCALELDAGPMSGFDAAQVDEAFFAGTTIRSNFLVNLGYGDRTKLHPRNPRLSFGDIARIA